MHIFLNQPQNRQPGVLKASALNSPGYYRLIITLLGLLPRFLSPLLPQSLFFIRMDLCVVIHRRLSFPFSYPLWLWLWIRHRSSLGKLACSFLFVLQSDLFGCVDPGVVDVDWILVGIYSHEENGVSRRRQDLVVPSARPLTHVSNLETNRHRIPNS